MTLHPDDLLASCFMLKRVIETVREDYPEAARKLSSVEDYLRSCAGDEPEVEHTGYRPINEGGN